MKKLIQILFSGLLFAAVVNTPAWCQFVTRAEASVAAKHWIQMVTDRYGSWGGDTSARAGEIRDYTCQGRMIGYYCKVEPGGYIILSLRKELAPVKAYAETGSYDPGTDRGEQDFVRQSMFRIIEAIESGFGPVVFVAPGGFAGMAYKDFHQQWENVLNYTVEKRENSMTDHFPDGTYHEGGTLMDSRYHQYAPYNQLCPFMNCNPWQRVPAGCGAIALAQVLNFWSWPPYGGSPEYTTYDWINILDSANTGSPPAQINAVARLCSDAGTAMNTSYGCDGSTSDVWGIDGAIENYFSFQGGTDIAYRAAHFDDTWRGWLKGEINKNRPVLYFVWSHVIVADGWRETVSGSTEFHMNYGWDDVSTNWYVLDELYLGNSAIEMMIRYIVPEGNIGTSLQASYQKETFPYRYFDRNVSGSDVYFEPGQYLQLLAGVSVTGTGSTTSVKFLGATYDHTYLYTDGITSRGIRIGNGSVGLKNNGTFKIHELPGH